MAAKLRIVDALRDALNHATRVFAEEREDRDLLLFPWELHPGASVPPDVVMRVVEAANADADARAEYGLEQLNTVEERSSVITSNLLSPWIVSYLGERSSRAHDEKTIDLLYDRLREQFALDHLPAVVTAPLGFFRSPLTRIDLGDGVEIVELDRVPLGTEIAMRLQAFWGGSPFEIHHWTHAIRIHFKCPKGGAIDLPERDRCETLEATIRLLLGGHVRARRFLFELEPPALAFPYGGGRSMIFGRGMGERVTGDPVTLHEASATQLSELFTRVEIQLAHDKLFAFALRRLVSAGDRERVEDALVDLWIALEALFTERESRSEVTFKVSLRAARFVGQTQEERLALKAKLTKSYGLRSDIVHGREPQPAKLREQTEQTSETVRRALRLWVDPARRPGIEDIDRALMK